MLIATVGSHQRFPKVICPGCHQPMTLQDLRPVMFTTSLYCGTYRCTQCGVDTKREFKDVREERRAHHQRCGNGDG
jgi:hypothetical protein